MSASPSRGSTPAGSGGGGAAGIASGAGVTDLEAQHAHLLDYAKRLEVELRAYQARYPTVPLDEAELEDAKTDAVPPWVSAPDALSPLLAAYDERIAELEAANKRHGDTIAGHRATVEALTKENEQLHTELQEATARLVQQASDSGSGAAGLGISFGGSVAQSEAMAELQERLDATVKECSILQEQVSTLMQDADQLRANVAERDSRLVQFTQRFHAANAAAQRLTEENKQLKSDLSACESRVRAQAGSVSDAAERQERANAELKKSTQVIASLRRQVDEYKQALREVSSQADSEADALGERARGAIQRSRELKAKLDETTAGLDSANDQLRAARAELETCKRDCSGMLKVMQSQEKQLQDYAAREATWETMERTAAEKVEEALLERDQAEARETQSRREIARLLERRRVDAAEALRQQSAATAAVRERLLSQMKSRDDEVAALSMRCAELQAVADQAARDRRTAEREVDRIVEAAAEEQGKLHELVEGLSARLREAESARDENASALAAASSEADAAAQEWARERERLSNSARAKQTSLEEAEAALAVRETECRRLSVRCEDALAALKRAREEKDEIQSRLGSDLAAMSSARERERTELSERLERLQSNYQESQMKLGATRTELEHLQQRSRLDLKAAQQEASKLVAEQKEEVSRLRARTEELTARLREAIARQEHADTAIAEEQRSNHHMHSRLTDAERRASDAAGQLALVLAQQEDRLRELKNMRTDLDRARLAEARAVRRSAALEKRVTDLKEQLEQSAQPLAIAGGSGSAAATQALTAYMPGETTHSARAREREHDTAAGYRQRRERRRKRAARVSPRHGDADGDGVDMAVSPDGAEGDPTATPKAMGSGTIEAVDEPNSSPR